MRRTRWRSQTMVAALPVSRWIEEAPGWSTKKFLPSLHVYREAVMMGRLHRFAAPVPLEDDAAAAVEPIRTALPRSASVSQVGLRIGRSAAATSPK